MHIKCEVCVAGFSRIFRLNQRNNNMLVYVDIQMTASHVGNNFGKLRNGNFAGWPIIREIASARFDCWTQYLGVTLSNWLPP